MLRGARRRAWVLVMVAVVVAGLWPLAVEAAGRLTAPSGWGESAMAAPEAQRRAGAWQQALGLRLAQVISAPAGDRFAETVAVFERSEPVFAQDFVDEAAAIAALTEAVADLVGSLPPDQAELRHTSEDQRFAWGRWFIDDLAYECVLAPSGGTATIVIAAVLAEQADAHHEQLALMFEGLEGVSPPMPRFSLRTWRLGSIAVWLALALALHAAMLPLSDRDHDHRQAGARASAIGLVLVLIGSGLAVVSLQARELALIHAGSSLASLGVWFLVSGVIVVGTHFLIASRFDRGVVRSAPSSGAFASGTYSNADILRSSITRSGVFRAELESSSGQRPSGDAAASHSRGRIIIDEAERE
jgi:hypothetical protein